MAESPASSGEGASSRRRSPFLSGTASYAALGRGRREPGASADNPFLGALESAAGEHKREGHKQWLGRFEQQIKEQQEATEERKRQQAVVAASREQLVQLVTGTRTHPSASLETMETLLRMCSTVVAQPDAKQPRQASGAKGAWAGLAQIKARSTTLKRCVLDAPGGLATMHLLGWRIRVANFERCWCFDHQPGSQEWRVLLMGIEVLKQQIGKLQTKLEFEEHMRKSAKAGREELREKTRLAIKDDKVVIRKFLFTYEGDRWADEDQQPSYSSDPADTIVWDATANKRRADAATKVNGSASGIHVLPVGFFPPRAWNTLTAAVAARGAPAFSQALAPRPVRMPRPPGLHPRCQLASCSSARRFKSRELNLFLAVLFESLPSAVHMAGLPPVELSAWDLFHGHLFFSAALGQLGLLFHAKEYPARDPGAFPINLGYCQCGSRLAYDPRAQEARNLLFVGGSLAALDLGGGSPLRRALLAPGLGDPVFTLLEEDFGLPLGEVNYLAFAANRKPAERVFVLGVRTFGFGSHTSDNEPEVMEMEKQRALKGQSVPHVRQVPGWSERLASDSEAVVKAERECPDCPPSQMQEETIHILEEEARMDGMDTTGGVTEPKSGALGG
eukprot:scaffold1.g5630.t1